MTDDPELGNEEAITAALEVLGSNVKGVKRGYVEASCPLAPWRHDGGVDKNPSFGVVYSSADAKKEEGHAHCFSCQYSGDVREIASLMHVWGALSLEDLSTVMDLMGKVKTGSLPLSLSAHHDDDPFPDEGWLAGFPKVSSEYPTAVEYLTERGITRQIVEAFDLRFDPKRYRVCVPLYDRAQRFRGLIGRTLIKEPMGPRYYYYPYPTAGGHAPKGFTWLNENNLDLAKPVVVVEGVFDAMKVWPVYPNVVAALSVSFRKPGMGWHPQVARWVSMFDRGKGGQLARGRLETHVASKNSRVWHLDPPPGRDDPGDSTPEEIKAQLETLSVAQSRIGV